MTFEEVVQTLEALKEQEGSGAVATWITTHGTELSEEVLEEVLGKYSVEALIEEAKDLKTIGEFSSELDRAAQSFEQEQRAIEAELKTRDVKDRLGMND